MADYKNMYFVLFNKITDTIKELQEVQQQTEEIYTSQEENVIELIDLSKNDDYQN